jgi:hypothetical protein
MRTSIRVAAVAAITALSVCLPLAAQRDGKGNQALQEREKAMAQLAADARLALDRLKGLSGEQKNAVVALMAISRASAAYESRFLKKDDAPLRAFYRDLGQFSPAYQAPGNFIVSLRAACFDQTVACVSAQAKCRKGGKTDAECERSFEVIEACANEMACMTNELRQLHKGFPTILGGRPWPPGPQPFPY